ncbi:hypothetical protein C484_08368 [Natrialba taiwanensis DSM 12281]|uniref:Uncharacterized protein n=2 Tax=Natrialba taiwanensis TaxID=160846 RepID=M0A5K1_9EURY|nr:hypothetical protein C484_08368 [Natrialba taiwanensis DSM 12281]
MTSAASHRTDVTDGNEDGSENNALVVIFGSTNRGERGRRIRAETALAPGATIDEGSKRMFGTQTRSSTAVKPATTGGARLTAAGEKADDRNAPERPRGSDSLSGNHSNGDPSSRAGSLLSSHSTRGSRNSWIETIHADDAKPDNNRRSNNDSGGCPRTSRVVARSRRADRTSTAGLDSRISTVSSKRTYKTQDRSNTVVRPDSRTDLAKAVENEFAASEGPIGGTPNGAISADNPSHSTSGVTTPNPNHNSDASADTMTPLSVAATEPNPSSVRVSRADRIVHSHRNRHRSTDSGPRTRNRTAEVAIGR